MAKPLTETIDAVAPVSFDPASIRKYDGFGPRYTSYPTADRFTEVIGAEQFAHALLSREIGSAQPLSVYVHLPFCDTICYYCACNKVTTRDHGRSGKYLRYLAKEIEIVAGLVDSTSPVTQLHWGGGTPTFLSTEEMTQLMRVLRENFKFASGAECSVEIDPRKVDAAHRRAARRTRFQPHERRRAGFRPRCPSRGEPHPE